MKKLFVSCPMRGRTKENIKNSIDRMHEVAELIFGEPLELINPYVPDKLPEGAREDLWYLGERIKRISDADYFIGIRNSYEYFQGCDIEYSASYAYKIPGYLLNIPECAFLKDAYTIALSKEMEMGVLNVQECIS